MKQEKSNLLYEESIKRIPGGVNSPVRACKSVNRTPLFIKRADGPYMFDEDGNMFIDYIGSWGPMILGHRDPEVIDAITSVLKKGTSFGAPTNLEIKLASMIIDAIDSVEMVRMVNSGTEAAMSAVRLARGYTGRDTIIKFDGCYHGHADTFLVEAGSGVATLSIPGSPGVPESIIKHTISVPYNNIDAVEKIMVEKGNTVAAIIVEPIAGNMGMVLPEKEFLGKLRKLTAKNGTLLIFDEVMTGFRVAHGGAQAIYEVEPDITCLGKIIGGGLPVGAYGGKREIMRYIAPEGPVYQAGTLSGNPVAMAAGIATLTKLKQPGFYETLSEKTNYLARGLRSAAKKAGVKVKIYTTGSMLGLFFTEKEVTNFDDAKKCNTDMFVKYYTNMLDRGVYLAPSAFEALFVSSVHGKDILDKTIEAAEESMK